MLFLSSNVSGSKPAGNVALFRTGALAGSALIWGVMGYLALNYVPKLVTTPPLVDTTIVGVPDEPDVLPPPPIVRPEPVQSLQNANPSSAPSTPQTPRLTIRQSQSTLANPLAGEFPAGEAPSEPTLAIGGGDGTLTVTIEPPAAIIAEPVIEPAAAPPMPQLIINPVRVLGTNPTYPPRALDRDIMGEVTLAFTVSATGSVENIQVTDEQPSGYGFARAAREAIQGWRFQPQTIDGVAVAYPARYTFSFKLED